MVAIGSLDDAVRGLGEREIGLQMRVNSKCRSVGATTIQEDPDRRPGIRVKSESGPA
jgi:hypothetical protein